MNINTEHWLRPTAIAFVVALCVSGCGEGGSSSAGDNYGQTNTTYPKDDTDDTAFGQAQLLTAITDNVLIPTYQEFLAVSQTQSQSVADYCGALTNDADAVPLKLEAAQQDWKKLADVWQQAEMMQLGPLSANNYSLRNTIYSWPIVSRCGVDQDVVYAENGSINGTAYDIGLRTDTRRGLDALEYLLFSTDLNHQCNSNVAIVDGWNQRSVSDRSVARCQFAELVAEDLVTNAGTLVSSWVGDNGYGAVLKGAGGVNNDFETTLQGINVISDAMFYLDSVTKDSKIAKPVGILDNNCGGDICLEHVEAAASGYSIDNIRNNLEGFSKLFFGNLAGSADTDSVGFDDFLIDAGDAQTAAAMGESISAAKAYTTNIDDSMIEMLEQDPEAVEALHGQVKAVTDKLKTDFITSLALELPQTSAGDND